MKTVLYVFAGRRPNIALQLPLVRRALDLNPDIEYHIWDLAKTPKDSAYLRSIQGDGITVWTQFAGENPWQRFKDVYAWYTRPEYRDCLFVKIDDDVVFFEANRFDEFLAAAQDNPATILTPKVINNGAGSTVDGGLWACYEDAETPLLDVHKSAVYADLCHRYFFSKWRHMVGQHGQLVPTDEWLSINMIALSYEMNAKLYSMCGQPAQPYIAGRTYDPSRHVMGDEGVVNCLPRMIDTGFVAAHLSFGPQQLTDTQLDEYRAEYGRIGAEYLA